MRGKNKQTIFVLLLVLFLSWPSAVLAEEMIENAGVGIGVGFGNTVFLPLKAFTVPYGVVEGALSFILTFGDTEVASQTWRDTREGPYWISPEVARMGIGSRPEIEQQ